jgi:hypothetical protein
MTAMKNIQYIFLVLSGLSLASCEEVIEVDVPENTVKLVVEAAVTTETDSSFVRLTRSVGFFDNTSSTPFVTNAAVSVNGVAFTHKGNGVYRAASPYTATVNTRYNLNIVVDGKTYTSTSFLEEMFEIDTVIPVFKPEDMFGDAGYTVKYIGRDTRPPVKYTYFRFGFNSLETSGGRDSIEDFRVLFDNKSMVNNTYEFEIPGLRLQPNDTSIMIFRSIDEPVYRYYFALGNRSSGGPFSTPPANLPTNIIGKEDPALGLFAAYDVKRYRTRIVE